MIELKKKLDLIFVKILFCLFNILTLTFGIITIFSNPGILPRIKLKSHLKACTMVYFIIIDE